MILTIWRHGEAGRAPTDRDRELTDSGRDDVGFACQQFHSACSDRGIPHPDSILHSPFMRSNQTAEIIAAAFTHATQTWMDALHPGSDVAAVDSALIDIAEGEAVHEHVLLVSHQPLISYLLDHYLGDPGAVPALSPGGLATLSLETPAKDCGRILFWAQPPEFEASL